MLEQAIGNLSGIFWIFLLVIPLLLLKALLQNPKVKGRIGERAVRSVIGKDLDEETYIEFHDLIIPSRSSTTQIDHIYVSVFGIFVIETKHYFQNPLRQNYAHIKALSELLQLPEEKFHSMVVFLGDCELKTQMPPNVCRIRQAASYIRRFQTTLLLPQEIEAATAVLSSNEYQADGEKLRAHTERLQERHQR